jgi:hypothetical protein
MSGRALLPLSLALLAAMIGAEVVRADPPEPAAEAAEGDATDATEEPSDDADSEPEAEASAQAYARIIVDTAPMRSGPGPSFRQVGTARRGEVYPIRQRASVGYWFQIERPDSTLAWVLGDAVYVHDEGAEATHFMPRLFAPPPLPDARGEIAIVFGALGGGGFMALRPSFLLSPVAGVELTAGASVSRAGRILLGAVGGIVNLAPRSPIVPYVVVGGGVAHSDPNADTFLLRSGTVGMFYGGGGLRFAFRYRLILRAEVRAYAFIEPDRYVSDEEYSGGLTVFY